MQKNDIVTVTAIACGTQGEGVAKEGGFTLFIPYLLPGERASVKILKVKGNVAYAKIEEILTPAEERVRPQCPAFHRCGGCQFQHLRYRDQLKYKTTLLKDTLRKIGGITAPVQPCERSEKEYGYRNKLSLPVGRQNGENVVGFYAERSHRIVPTDECPIHPEWSKKLIAALKSFMEKCGLDGYDEQTRKGQIRHIVVRELRKKYIVTLVVTVPVLHGIDYFTHLLDSIFPEYSLYLNVNKRDTNVIFGEQFLLVKGKPFYDCSEAGILFEAGPNTFVQVNDGVRGKLYEKVVELCESGPVIDCYSGGGLLTAMLAKKYGKAYGIEIVPEASACANELAKKNGLENVMTNVCGKVEENLAAVISSLCHSEPQASESPCCALSENITVVLDPPRAGVERSVLKEIMRCGVKRIVMVSCNPATLARDLGILAGTLTETESGELLKTENPHPMYEITLLQPYDMFPQTKHIETVACLKLRS